MATPPTELETVLAQYIQYQENSQVYLGPPVAYNGPEPERYSEVYITNLRPDVDIHHLFLIAGGLSNVIYQIRLPITYTAGAKGYCYVRYFSERLATSAIQALNGTPFMGRSLSVTRSFDTRDLQVLLWPRNLSMEESQKIIQTCLKDVTNVRIFEDMKNGTPNSGFIVLEFKGHNQAAVGRRDIKQGRLRPYTGVEDHPMSWARGDMEVPEDHFRETKDLYVGNLPPNVTRLDLLREIIYYINPKEVAVKINRNDNGTDKRFGFLYFKDHDAAMDALLQLRASSICIGGLETQFHWVKGPYAKKKDPTRAQAFTQQRIDAEGAHTLANDGVRTPAPGRGYFPADDKAHFPTVEKVDAPAAGRVQFQPGARAHFPTVEKVDAPAAGRVQFQPGARAHFPTVEKVDAPAAGRVQFQPGARALFPTVENNDVPERSNVRALLAHRHPMDRPSASGFNPVQKSDLDLYVEAFGCRPKSSGFLGKTCCQSCQSTGASRPSEYFRTLREQHPVVASTLFLGSGSGVCRRTENMDVEAFGCRPKSPGFPWENCSQTTSAFRPSENAFQQPERAAVASTLPLGSGSGVIEIPELDMDVEEICVKTKSASLRPIKGRISPTPIVGPIGSERPGALACNWPPTPSTSAANTQVGDHSWSYFSRPATSTNITAVYPDPVWSSTYPFSRAKDSQESGYESNK